MKLNEYGISEYAKNPYTLDALGRGVPSKADIVSNLSEGGCMNLRTKGEGVKKSEHLADVIYGSPPRRYARTLISEIESSSL